MQSIRARAETDNGWILPLLEERWGGRTMVVGGRAFDLMTLPGLVYNPACALVTYRLIGRVAEIMSLDAVVTGQGIGTRLLEDLVFRLRAADCSELWVTTTNDNLEALRFYQRRGFALQRLRPRAVEAARRLKPSIPASAENGIPIRDELDLCRNLQKVEG